MPLPPFNDVSDERQMPIGMSLGPCDVTAHERTRLHELRSRLSTRAGIAALVKACDGKEFSAEKFMAYLNEDAELAVPLLDLLVVRGILTITASNTIRVCQSSGLLAS